MMHSSYLFGFSRIKNRGVFLGFIEGLFLHLTDIQSRGNTNVTAANSTEFLQK